MAPLMEYKWENRFFAHLIDNIHVHWMNIEYAYFYQVKEMASLIENSYSQSGKYNKISDYKSLISQLNSDLFKIKLLLINYLKYVNSSYVPHINETLDDLFHVSNIDGIAISRKLFLNFNYTHTLHKYINPSPTLHNDSLINIHGKIESELEIIFGYGDENDPITKVIEYFNESEFLKNMKSFGYVLNSKASALTEFMNDEFIVYVIGHSCGLSDRT